MVTRARGADTCGVADRLIERDEVVALLFNVSEVVFQVTQIKLLLLEEDDGEEEED